MIYGIFFGLSNDSFAVADHYIQTLSRDVIHKQFVKIMASIHFILLHLKRIHMFVFSLKTSLNF